MSKPKIMIADDERVVADTTKLVLATRGYEVFTVYSLDEIEPAAQTHTPDLVLLDVHFHGRHSLPIAERLRKMGCRVLLMSGVAETSDLLESNPQSQPLPILAKPVHPKELLQQIDLLFGKDS